MPATYTLISSTTVGSGGASSIDFTSIPATYTDLVIKLSARLASGVDCNFGISFNSSTANFSYRLIQGNGAAASSSNGTSAITGLIVGTAGTSSTFSSTDIYIPNYAGSTNKPFSTYAVTENNGTTAYIQNWANLWSNTSAITAISFNTSGNGNFGQYTTAYLYGISNA